MVCSCIVFFYYRSACYLLPAATPLALLLSRGKAGFWSDGWGALPFWLANRARDEIIVNRLEKSYKPLTGPTTTEKIWLQVTSFTLGLLHPGKHGLSSLCNPGDRAVARKDL